MRYHSDNENTQIKGTDNTMTCRKRTERKENNVIPSVTHVKNLVISYEREKKGGIVITINGTYLLSSVSQIFHNGLPSHDDNCKCQK